MTLSRTKGGVKIIRELVQVVQFGDILEILFLIVRRGEIGTRKGFFQARSRFLVMRREDLGVTVHMAAAARWHLEYVHVETQFAVPGEQPVVIVHLHARRSIILRDEGATRLWIPGIYGSISSLFNRLGGIDRGRSFEESFFNESPV